MLEEIPAVPPESGLNLRSVLTFSVMLWITLFSLTIFGIFILIRYGVPWLLCSLMYAGQCG